MDPSNYVRMSASRDAEAPDIPVITYVPSAQNDILALANPSGPTADFFSDVSPPVGSPPDTAGSAGSHATSFPSFAQMLKQGKPKPTVVQQPAVPVSTNTVAAAEAVRSVENEDGEVVLSASFGDEFGNALKAAFDNLNAEPVGSKSCGDKKGGKKKKGKGKVIFSM